MTLSKQEEIRWQKMRISKIIGITLLLSLATSFANKKENPEVTKEKTYSESEFKDAVDKAVAERLKKVQVSNLSKYSQELLDKERKIELREQDIERKLKQLTRNEQSFAKSVIEFKDKQSKFIGCLDENEKKKAERVNRLVSVVSGMKPLKAAEILSVQDSELSVRILAELEPTKASKIFNLMDKEISARLQKQYLLMKQ